MTSPNTTSDKLDVLGEILHDLWESAQNKEPRITKFKAKRQIQAYFKTEMNKLIPEELIDDTDFIPPLGGFKTIYKGGTAYKLHNALVRQIRESLDKWGSKDE